jgi:hypothetical protein
MRSVDRILYMTQLSLSFRSTSIAVNLHLVIEEHVSSELDDLFSCRRWCSRRQIRHTTMEGVTTGRIESPGDLRALFFTSMIRCTTGDKMLTLSSCIALVHSRGCHLDPPCLDNSCLAGVLRRFCYKFARRR